MDKLNRHNTEHSHETSEVNCQRLDDRGGGGRRATELILDGADPPVPQSTKEQEEVKDQEEDRNIFEDSESDEEAQGGKVDGDGKTKHIEEADEFRKSGTSQRDNGDVCKTSLSPQERYFFHLYVFFFIMNRTAN